MARKQLTPMMARIIHMTQMGIPSMERIRPLAAVVWVALRMLFTGIMGLSPKLMVDAAAPIVSGLISGILLMICCMLEIIPSVQPASVIAEAMAVKKQMICSFLSSNLSRPM